MLSKKLFFGAAIGTMIEYYDYALFAIFLPLISPLFFPANTTFQSLEKGYLILLIAMLARPFGGLFFGYFGDLLGRPKALLGSMYGIAIATFLVGLVPSALTIGTWAAVALTLAKAIQLFCFGGEYNGAGIYVVEHAQNKNEALLGSFLTATTLFGALLASLVGVITTLQVMPSWSWRIAFFIGGVIGVLGVFYRKNLLDSPGFKASNNKQHSFKKLLQTYPRELIAGVFVGGFATLPFTTVITFLNPVLMTKGFYNSHQLMLSQTFLIVIAIISLVSAGKVADKISPNKTMQFGALLLVLLSYPLLRMVDQGSLYSILFAQIIFIIINEILLGPSNAYLKNAFSMEYRYRGSSFSYCLGMSLIGGLTPVVEGFLYQRTGSFSAISLWLILIGLGTFISLRMVKRSSSVLLVA
jgi:MHS family proline/betaine transporter-like MFS transporter